MAGSCFRCGSPTEPDADPSVFAYYCRNCGYRHRIAGQDEQANEPHDAEWRRQHGFPE